MPQTASGFTVPAGTDPISSIDDTMVTMAGEIAAKTINPTIVDAKGDLIAATAADTVARLAVGTDNYTLFADSTQSTGLRWGVSGGATLISTTAVTGTSAVTISGIPTSLYRDILIVIANIGPTAGGASLNATFNGANIHPTATTGNTTTTAAALPLAGTLSTGTGHAWTILISRQNIASTMKTFLSLGAYMDNALARTNHAYFGNYDAFTGITSITLTTSGTFANRGNVYIYGVN